MKALAHLLVSGLFPPPEATGWFNGLRLPALEQILARAECEKLPATALESWLCEAYGMADGALAPVTLQGDGGQPGDGYWMRAEPVHLLLRGSQVIQQPVALEDAQQAGQLCESLNRHFSGQGLQFVAPVPTHWYLRLADDPGVVTLPFSQVAGRDIRTSLPQGPAALNWHKLLNEIQMLLAAHPLNDEREAHGEATINSLWLWGGGVAPEKLACPYNMVYTDTPLAGAVALAAGVPHAPLPPPSGWLERDGSNFLALCTGPQQALQKGDFTAWRDALLGFERDCAAPALRALRAGIIREIALDILQEDGRLRCRLTRRLSWRFWRRPRDRVRFPALAT